jgi:Sec-independent protein translocase protein TatA
MADDKRTQHVSLGCGTLILIALIVLIFSRHGLAGLRTDVQDLCSEIGELKKAVASQTDQIKSLQERLDKWRPDRSDIEKSGAEE